MSRKCEICGKSRQLGYNVSHAHNRTRKISYPNLQRLRVTQEGRTLTLKVCTRCIRAGRIRKAS